MPRSFRIARTKSVNWKTNSISDNESLGCFERHHPRMDQGESAKYNRLSLFATTTAIKLWHCPANRYKSLNKLLIKFHATYIFGKFAATIPKWSTWELSAFNCSVFILLAHPPRCIPSGPLIINQLRAMFISNIDATDNIADILSPKIITLPTLVLMSLPHTFVHYFKELRLELHLRWRKFVFIRKSPPRRRAIHNFYCHLMVTTNISFKIIGAPIKKYRLSASQGVCLFL